MAGRGGWWVIPEGTIGVGVSLIGGGSPSLFTVTQSVSKPRGATAGPYATQALAQAKADSLNGAAATANPLTSPASNPLAGISDLAHRLTESQTWLRVGEVVAGLILLYVGLKTEFPTVVHTIAQPVKSTATGTFNAAKLGLI